MEGQDLVEQDIEKTKGIKFLQRDLSNVSDGKIRHDPNLVAKSIIELICDDLKYQDKQNDPQYLMLNNKLREDKRISKLKKNAKKEKMKKANAKRSKSNTKSKSKFSSKYSERIASIKESDEKIKRKSEAHKKEKSMPTKTKTATTSTKPKSTIKNESSKPKEVVTSTPRKKTPREIREEMLRKLEGK